MKKRKIAMLSLLGVAVVILCGCAGGKRRLQEDVIPAQKDQREETEAEEVETETETYEIETETDLFGEVEMRSIWEIMPEETRVWAEEFAPHTVEKLVYTTYMEGEAESFEVRDRARIVAAFDAINQMTVAGSMTNPGSVGDTISFVMKDGSEQKFTFSLSCIVVDGITYETDNTEALWELTGRLLFGEEESE